MPVEIETNGEVKETVRFAGLIDVGLPDESSICDYAEYYDYEDLEWECDDASFAAGETLFWREGEDPFHPDGRGYSFYAMDAPPVKVPVTFSFDMGNSTGVWLSTIVEEVHAVGWSEEERCAALKDGGRAGEDRTKLVEGKDWEWIVNPYFGEDSTGWSHEVEVTLKECKETVRASSLDESGERFLADLMELGYQPELVVARRVGASQTVDAPSGRVDGGGPDLGL